MIPYPEPCLFTESFQRLNGERGTERFTRASKSTCVALKGGFLDTSAGAERVGDNGSTSYVRSFLGIFDSGRSRGARIMGNLQKRKGTKEISTRKGQALHARNA